MARIQSRILLILVLVIVFLIIGLTTLNHWEGNEAQSLLSEQRAAKEKSLKDVIALQGRSLANIAYDYTSWDEMVSFVGSGDPEWAVSNLDVSLKTYQITAAWVCRPDLSLVYGCDDTPDDSLRPLPIKPADSSLLFSDGYFRHYFMRSPDGFLEIRCAPIQPTYDSRRITPPRGFFFVAKLWTDSLLSSLANFVGGPVVIAQTCDTLTPWLGDDENGIIRFAETVPAWDKKPLAVVRGEYQSGLFKELRQATLRQTWMVVIFGAVLIGLMSFGLHRWVSQPLTLITDAVASEKPHLMESLSRDKSEHGRLARTITQFFEQKQELIRSHQKIAALAEEQLVVLNNTRDFVYRHDLNGVFHYLSASIKTVTGYEAEEFMRHYTTYMTDNPINAKVVEFTEQALRTGEPSPPYLVEVRHRDGQTIVLEVSEQPYTENEQIAGIVGIARDVTERFKAEQEYRQVLLKLEKAQRMESLGVLAGGVAHDLNNVLGPLVAYPELILLKLPADSPLRDKIEAMGRSASQAASIIQDLLTLARRGRYDMAPLQINDIIRTYVNSPNFLDLRRRHPEIQLHLNLDASLPIIRGSAAHLSNVFMNIVVNAFDAMQEGGTLQIRSRSAFVDRLASGFTEVVHGDYIIVTVSDTGVGIAKDDLTRIFEPYYSKKLMSKSSGTGLGLSIVYGIVKDHNGYYDIESAVGTGTDFSLLFPAVGCQETRTDLPGIQILGRESILVVDDNDDQRLLAVNILEGLGYNVTSVPNGCEAVNFLLSRSVDLVVIDMIMENDFDGLDTFRRIREIHPRQKAVIVSGFAATDRVEEMQRLGAGDYVKKPYTQQELGKAVRQALDRIDAPITTVPLASN